MSRRTGPFEVQRHELVEAIDLPSASQCSGLTTFGSVVSHTPSVYGPAPAVLHHRRKTKAPSKVVPLFIEKTLNDETNTENDPLKAPDRNYDCKHYDVCLSLAAALDWDSFCCSGCSGCVNRKLLWRAHHLIRKNKALRRICDLPMLS